MEAAAGATIAVRRAERGTGHVVLILARIVAEGLGEENLNVHHIVEVPLLELISARLQSVTTNPAHMKPQFHLPFNILGSVQEAEPRGRRHEPCHSSV